MGYIDLSKWDSEHFGIKIGRYSAHTLEDICSDIKQAKTDGYELLIARIPTDCLDIVNKLERHGFRVKDTLVRYRISLEDINFLERFPDQHRLFVDDDYLDIKGRITARSQLVFTDFNFNGKFKDNRVTGGTLIGNFDNRDFNFSEFSFRSGNQKMQSSISGNIESGLSADIVIDQIDFSLKIL